MGCRIHRRVHSFHGMELNDRGVREERFGDTEPAFTSTKPLRKDTGWQRLDAPALHCVVNPGQGDRTRRIRLSADD